MRSRRAALVARAWAGALALLLASCSSGAGPEGADAGAGATPDAGADATPDAGADATPDAGDTAAAGDAAPDGDADAGVGDVTDGGCAVASCVEPCVFSFRSVADDRDGVSEVRLAAIGGAAGIVSIELVDVPDWVTFSSRFADYLGRISASSWSIDSTLRFVSEGDAIEVPAGESFAIELRADDPGSASCPAGSCGFVRVSVHDCAAGTSAVDIPVAR